MNVSQRGMLHALKPNIFFYSWLNSYSLLFGYGNELPYLFYLFIVFYN